MPAAGLIQRMEPTSSQRGPGAELDIVAIDAAAFEAFDRFELELAAERFRSVVAALDAADPKLPERHYMAGLAYKYLARWADSLQHNLAAQALCDTPDQATAWNAGIAATALGDWYQARQQWALAGIAVPSGDGAIEADFGVCGVRLNPSGNGETLFAQRIDVVRARLHNVPLSESGFQYGDIVLHDGAATGRRRFGEGSVAVFNVLERLARSEFRTFTVFANAPGSADIAALQSVAAPGLGSVEDWTASMTLLCLRCSYGIPHEHSTANNEPVGWQPERNLGIAATHRRVVEHVLERWLRNGRGRRVDAIEWREHAVPPHRYDSC